MAWWWWIVVGAFAWLLIAIPLGAAFGAMIRWGRR